jgi:hypothetical protein
VAASVGSPALRVPGRVWGDHRFDPPIWGPSARSAAAGCRPVWPLAAAQGHRRAKLERADGARRLRWPIDNPTFFASIEQVLVPTLRPGHVVVLDNLAMHKQPEVQTATEREGTGLRFLPPYSPDFNPIELAFAKLKAVLRAMRPRAFDHVCQIIAAARGLYRRGVCQLRMSLRVSRCYVLKENALSPQDAHSGVAATRTDPDRRRPRGHGPVQSLGPVCGRSIGTKTPCSSGRTGSCPLLASFDNPRMVTVAVTVTGSSNRDK